MENTVQSSAGLAGQIRPPSALARFSTGLAQAEILLAGVLMFLLFVLLLANVTGRFLGVPLIWVDELAVYLMVIVAFLAAAAALDARQHIAVTLLSDMMSPRAAGLLRLLADLILLAFLLALAWMVWIWFDPLTAAAAETLDAFAAQSFNFIYQEPTVTLGVRKVWFWLILPVFAVTATIHCLAQIEADLRLLKGAGR
jgi:TRAP-type C4-dicarboxylate transport system permease small subunit